MKRLCLFFFVMNILELAKASRIEKRHAMIWHHHVCLSAGAIEKGLERLQSPCELLVFLHDGLVPGFELVDIFGCFGQNGALARRAG